MQLIDLTLRNPIQNKALQRKLGKSYDGDFGMSAAERLKNNKYKIAVEEEDMIFIPFVIATTGGTGKRADDFIKTLAMKYAEEKSIIYSYSVGLLRNYINSKFQQIKANNIVKGKMFTNNIIRQLNEN